MKEAKKDLGAEAKKDLGEDAKKNLGEEEEEVDPVERDFGVD